MNQNIIAYLKENKDRYPQDALIEQLRKSGYLEQDIQEGIVFIYADFGKAALETGQSDDFWNFKTKKVYASSFEKRKDFLFGFFTHASLVFLFVFAGMLIFGSFGSSFSAIIPLIVLIIIIMASVYLFNRRRFIFYGILMGIIIAPFAALAAVLTSSFF